MELNGTNVEAVTKSCLFDKRPVGDEMEAAVLVRGITVTMGFSRARIEEKRAIIDAWLDQMNPTFTKGWSFLNLCEDKDGNLWTGFHAVMEMLIMLGMAIGRVEWCLPREHWNILPGGMPYLVIKPKESAHDQDADAPNPRRSEG